MFTGGDDDQLFPHFEQPKRKPVPEARSDGKRARTDAQMEAAAEPAAPPVSAPAAPPPAAPPAEATPAPPPQAQPMQVVSAGSGATAANDDEIIECLHEVAWPPGVQPPDEPKPKPDRPPARTYPFTLDPFQRASVQCLEREESVLVAAHTSAGKTVVAEYAIAMSLRDKQRVIYTSPIKALSNQKYRELYEDFQDVGLMTGDVTINPAASCLVMTTEILRSMLYRGSEVMREVKWVIFDEIHYMRDKERGVVWEETIILLPDQVRYVFLSATIPNALEFARWIAKIHSQPCHVVYTDRRPTPLQHYIFPAGGDGLHLVVDEKGVFREENFNKALSQLMSPLEKADKMKGKRGGKGNAGAAAGDAYKIVKMIMERKYDPVIVFAFSKKECEFLALQMSKLDFNNDDERKLIDGVFRNAVDSLSEDDKKLPQIEHILPLLKRGIGIHHSGLLPILKEVIEILFQEGLLKALFATETFSIGLNMPAKTVLFTSVRKFDGSAFRWLGGGEYIQMSGRAGRRGIDERGIVILCVDEKMEPAVAKGMLKGHADPLNSSFHLGYNMLLNLLRFEGVDPEFLIRRSFHQFQHDQHLPILQAKLAQLEAQHAGMTIPDVAVVEEYFLIRSQLEHLRGVMHKVMVEPIHMLPFMQPGRLVKVNGYWGVVINFQKKPTSALPAATAGGDNQPSQSYIVDTLLPPAASAQRDGAPPTSAAEASAAGMEITPVMLHTIQEVSSMRVHLPRDLRTVEARQASTRSVREVQKRFPDGIPLLDPVEDMQIEDEAFKKVLRKIEMLEDQLAANPTYSTPTMQGKYQKLIERKKLETDIRELKKQLKSADSVVMKDELKAMKRVLRRLGYTNADGIIEMKGRVCCEINAADEIVLSEMMFNGVFNDLTPEQCAALLSCFVFQEKSSENQKLPDELAGPLQTLQETARKVARVSQECKLTVNTEEYVQGFRPHLMDVVYQWAKGTKFLDVCKLTDIFEGSIIRCMRRLEELMRQLCQAAKAIGNTDLEQKFSDAIAKIKRDIVFAASLYL